MRWKPLLPLLLLIAAALAAMVMLHVRYVNGSPYWTWPWRDTSLLPPARWYSFMLLAAAPVLAAIAWAMKRPPQHTWDIVGILALLMIGVVAMKLTSLAILTRPASFDAMEAIVRSPSATSYYTDAAAIARAAPSGWLAIYPDLLPQTNLHTQSKPPGAIAYYLAWIRALGYGRASAVAGAIGLAVLAAFSIPATYLLVRLLCQSAGVATSAALMLALCPGYVLIFPTFDACYPILTAGLIGTWHLAHARGDWRFAAAFGVILGITTFITYNLLVLGAFLAASPMISGRAKPMRVIQYTAIAIGWFVCFYALLALFTQFDPIATFRSAWHNQRVLLAQHPQDRPYPTTILFDLLDFAFSGGWLPVVLAAIAIATQPAQRRLILLCLAQPIVVAVIGILQSETARAWNFMLPPVLIPAALELSRWPARPRGIVLLAMLALMLIVGHHMIFMVP
jgi:hypothetical protein